MISIIDNLTGYKDRETFETIQSFRYEINHSPFKISNSIRELLQKVKSTQIKYIKISKNSLLNTDLDGKLKKNSKDKTRHFFDFLMVNMIYDIIKNSNNLLTNWYIKTYVNEILDIIENFNNYPYDFDDFNRMNYGIFINDSKEYGGNCQIFSMIYELINFCSQEDFLRDEFINLCSNSKLKKYYIELINNQDELIKQIYYRKINNSKLNLIFWIVAVDIMTKLNKINENEYVITDSLLKSGFKISYDKIKIQNNIRSESNNKSNCVFYLLEKHCHVGFKTQTNVFDIDNMNNPVNETEFIDRACKYYDFDKSNLTKKYYNNIKIEVIS